MPLCLTPRTVPAVVIEIMATSELSLEQIHAFFIKNGGTVSNRDVVRHFRNYLTDPASKDDARHRFKKYVNMLATSRMDGDQKILTLRPVYTADDPTASSPRYDPMNSLGLPRTTPPSSNSSTPIRAPPPYRPPPPVVITSPQHLSLDNISVTSSNLSLNDHQLTPQAPPRKRTSEKLDFGRSQEDLTDNQEEDVGGDGEKQTISVKERTQKFNRMASVDDELSSPGKTPSKTKKKQKDKGADEDDGASVTSLEPKKCAAWYVATAKGDYQELAKLASKEPRLVKLKDPYTAYTVLHWGSKHGNVEIIKLFAGTYRADVNAKTNGGYVPLHIAAQFGHEDVFDILTKVYKADRSVRDFYGKRPEQYKSSHIEARQKAVNSEYGTSPKHGRAKRNSSFLRKNFSPNPRAKSAVLPGEAVHSSVFGTYKL